MSLKTKDKVGYTSECRLYVWKKKTALNNKKMYTVYNLIYKA